MKTVILIVLLLTTGIAKADDWFLFSDYLVSKEVTKCRKTGFGNTPAKWMQQLERRQVDYSVQNEKRDANGKVTSLVLHIPIDKKNIIYSRTKKSCEKYKAKANAKYAEKIKKEKDEYQSKYGDYE